MSKLMSHNNILYVKSKTFVLYVLCKIVFVMYNKNICIEKLTGIGVNLKALNHYKFYKKDAFI